jgi:hypothetical protein
MSEFIFAKLGKSDRRSVRGTYPHRRSDLVKLVDVFQHLV